MKRISITLYIICTTVFSLMAQKPISNLINIQGTIKENYELKDGSLLHKGTPVILQFITKLKKFDSGENPYQVIFSANGEQFYMPLHVLDTYFQVEKMDKEKFWKFAQLDNAKHYTNENDHSKIRREQILEAEKYIEELEKANMFYNDAAIEDYLQCLLLEITPTKDAFHSYTTQPVVRVLRVSAPHIMMLSNNTLLISTGMLATLDSEEELMALLSREVTHYLLDHALITVKKNMARARRAIFWEAVANGVIAATEEYLYERHDYFNPALFFNTSQIVNALINQNINKRMGMDYLEEQEKEADRYAIAFMENEGRNPYALSSALHKIKAYYENEKSSNALSKYQIFGTLSERLNKMGEPKELPEDRKYLKTMMNVVSYEAASHDYNKDYKNSHRLAMKNINHSLGTSDDYMIVALSIMKQSNTTESNEECLLYLEKADMISETENVNITKMRILLLLRENKQKQAVEQLKKYQELLNILFQQPHTEEDAQWITEEHVWAQKLLERIYML